MSSQMIVRLDEKTKSRVAKLAKAEGKSVSQVIRNLVDGYIRDRDVASYIDDLWKRTGAKMKAGGFGPKDVGRIVREVRRRK